jgi:hypothetical protein
VRAGDGDAVGGAWLDRAGPHREAAGVGQDLDVPSWVWWLPGYHRSCPAADLADERAVWITVPSRQLNAYPASRAAARTSASPSALAAITSMASCRYR